MTKTKTQTWTQTKVEFFRAAAASLQLVARQFLAKAAAAKRRW